MDDRYELIFVAEKILEDMLRPGQIEELDKLIEKGLTIDMLIDCVDIAKRSPGKIKFNYLKAIIENRLSARS